MIVALLLTALQASTPLPLPEVHGFLSQGLVLSTKNNYLVESKRGNADFTEVGLNLTEHLTDNLRTGVQLFSRRLGTDGAFAARFDWFYLDYTVANWLSVKVGRIKIPFGLYNATSDIDSARIPILLPQALYPIKSRDYLLAQTGAELYGYVSIPELSGFDYHLYAGTIAISTSDFGASSAADLQKTDTPYVIGGRLMWDTPLSGLRIGGTLEALELDVDLQLKADYLAKLKTDKKVPDSYTGTATLEAPIVLWVASAEYTLNDLHIAAEYSKWRVDLRPIALLSPHALQMISERYYGMISYSFNNWLQPSFYAAALYPNIEHRSKRSDVQYDYATSFRFDLTKFWLVKLEGHYMSGTAGLDPALNNNKPKQELAKDWTLFLAKTTLYF